ncbi:MAG: copper-binding protein [Nitrosomonadales bacterium]|nr:copper-binding protein [Nitrosomonadales bacterium]
MKRILILSAILGFSAVSGSAVAHEHDHEGMEMNAKAAVAEGRGVVESADQAKGVVTLTHEPIPSLNWPAMTMDFAVEDKALFRKLVPGKTVRFEFIKQRNKYVVTGVK